MNVTNCYELQQDHVEIFIIRGLELHETINEV